MKDKVVNLLGNATYNFCQFYKLKGIKEVREFIEKNKMSSSLFLNNYFSKRINDKFIKENAITLRSLRITLFQKYDIDFAMEVPNDTSSISGLLSLYTYLIISR